MTVRFEEELARHGRLVYTTMGRSMRPLLRQKRDLVVLAPPRGPLRRRDVALYRNGAGQYILHRVVGVGPDGYVFRGDNNAACERGIRPAQVVGVLTAFVRDGRETAVTSPAYRAYAALWCWLYGPRMAARRCRALARRLVRQAKEGRILHGDRTNDVDRL